MPSYQERPDLALGLLEDIEAGHDREYQEKNYPEPHASASAVIYCLRKAWCRYHPGQCQENPIKETAPERMPMTIGTALHAVMAKAEKATRSVNVPLRVKINGVWVVGEADSITSGEVHAIEDGKTTRKEGCTYSPERDPAYIEQLALYLVLHNLMFLDPIYKGVLHVWHMLFCYGSKAKGTTRDWMPGPTSWVIQFDNAWLNKWTDEIGRRAKIVTGPDLPAPNPYDWECGYCPFAQAKGGFCPGPTEDQIKQVGFFPLDRNDALESTERRATDTESPPPSLDLPVRG